MQSIQNMLRREDNQVFFIKSTFDADKKGMTFLGITYCFRVLRRKISKNTNCILLTEESGAMKLIQANPIQRIHYTFISCYTKIELN